MILSERGWAIYHEAVCSPGHPWDCQLRCSLWLRWQRHLEAQAKDPGPTYLDLERRTW